MLRPVGRADHEVMTDISAPPAPDSRSRRSRYGWGGAVLVLGAVAALGLFVGLGSQIVLFGDQSQQVEAEIYRPIIVPSLVALVAAAAAAVAWWITSVRDRGPRWAVAPFLAVGTVAMLAASALSGPSAVEVERRWTGMVGDLRLPATFASVPHESSLDDDYELLRRWKTDLDPRAACGAAHEALTAWLAPTPVGRTDDSAAGCRMTAVKGHDGISASVTVATDGPVTLVLYMYYVV